MRALKTVIALTFAMSLGGCGYNRIQALDERAEQARSNVGVALQNRNQLIPNLVATVKGAAEFERGTYTDVDSWTLAHTFPATGDGTSPALWLRSWATVASPVR